MKTTIKQLHISKPDVHIAVSVPDSDIRRDLKCPRTGRDWGFMHVTWDAHSGYVFHTDLAHTAKALRAIRHWMQARGYSTHLHGWPAHATERARFPRVYVWLDSVLPRALRTFDLACTQVRAMPVTHKHMQRVMPTGDKTRQLLWK